MIGPVIDSLLAGVPVLLLHFLVTLFMFGFSLWLYTLVTPHNELGLVRLGNTAAALSLGGAGLGLALPLGICLYSAVNIWDILLWGSVALLLQIAAFKLLDLILSDLPKRIAQNEMSAAYLLVLLKVALAYLLASALVS
jgi:putative membrane protein